MADRWVPRSQRLGRRDYDGPFQGVPTHLRGPLFDWLEAAFKDSRGEWHGGLMRDMALVLNVPIGSGNPDWRVFETIKAVSSKDQELFLDFVEGALAAHGVHSVEAKDLQTILTLAGSVLKIDSDQAILIDVTSPEAEATYAEAVSVEDEIAAEMREAWANAYGRNPDPSDAWDHAIKVIEHVLVPVVQPNNSKATLGNVLGVLGGQQTSAQWEMVLPGNDQSHDVGHFVSMLRLVWPNHDRHGGGSTRSASLDEARAVVGIAALVAQWHRQNWVVRKR